MAEVSKGDSVPLAEVCCHEPEKVGSMEVERPAGSFTFTVSYKDAGGESQTESVILKNGESNTITGIPKGVQVTVTETTTDGYTVIMKDPSTGTVLAGSSSYTFTMNNDTAVDIYNTSIVALPETGGIGQGIFLFAGIGLMLTAVIEECLLRRKYGKEAD